jgi:hypothetical protein
VATEGAERHRTEPSHGTEREEETHARSLHAPPPRRQGA